MNSSPPRRTDYRPEFPSPLSKSFRPDDSSESDRESPTPGARNDEESAILSDETEELIGSDRDASGETDDELFFGGESAQVQGEDESAAAVGTAEHSNQSSTDDSLPATGGAELPAIRRGAVDFTAAVSSALERDVKDEEDERKDSGLPPEADSDAESKPATKSKRGAPKGKRKRASRWAPTRTAASRASKRQRKRTTKGVDWDLEHNEVRVFHASSLVTHLYPKEEDGEPSTSDTTGAAAEAETSVETEVTGESDSSTSTIESYFGNNHMPKHDPQVKAMVALVHQKESLEQLSCGQVVLHMVDWRALANHYPAHL